VYICYAYRKWPTFYADAIARNERESASIGVLVCQPLSRPAPCTDPEQPEQPGLLARAHT